MEKKTLLLSATYQVDSFVNFKKAIKHIIKDKVEIVSNWIDTIKYGEGEINIPSILKLKNPIKRSYSSIAFSRGSLIKRDDYTCQYCSKYLSYSNITIDHVIPKVRGGASSYSNCVVACHTCNNFKADKTLEEVKMSLIKKPTHPTFYSFKTSLRHQDIWNKEWDYFIA